MSSQTPDHYGPGGKVTGTIPAEDRSMAMVAHLSTLASMVLSVGWLSFVGPLIVWAIYKDRSPFVRQAAAGAFNFNVSMWVLVVVGWILTFTLVLAVVGIPLLIVGYLGQLIFHIVGAVRANRGEAYRYPMQFLRILS